MASATATNTSAPPRADTREGARDTQMANKHLKHLVNARPANTIWCCWRCASTASRPPKPRRRGAHTALKCVKMYLKARVDGGGWLLLLLFLPARTFLFFVHVCAVCCPNLKLPGPFPASSQLCDSLVDGGVTPSIGKIGMSDLSNLVRRVHEHRLA